MVTNVEITLQQQHLKDERYSAWLRAFQRLNTDDQVRLDGMVKSLVKSVPHMGVISTIELLVQMGQFLAKGKVKA